MHCGPIGGRSLIPFVTGWMGENRLASVPTALYGVVLLMAAIAWQLLQWTILREEGPDSLLRSARGSAVEEKLSPVLYAGAILCAFLEPWIAGAIHTLVALMWLVPDRRIEKALA